MPHDATEPCPLPDAEPSGNELVEGSLTFDWQRGLTPLVKALKHPVRRPLLFALAAAGPLSASSLAERLGLEPPQVKYHLARLRMMGFAHALRHGRQVHYRIAPDTVRLVRNGPDTHLTLIGARGVTITLTLRSTMEESAIDSARMDVAGDDAGRMR